MRVLWALALISITAFVAACGGDDAPATKPSQARLSATVDPDGSGPVPARSNEVTAAAGARTASAPCRLVSRGQAQDILGESVRRPVEAPQGPTCIYRYGAGGKRFVTLVVQSIDVKALRRQAGKVEKLTVGRQAGFCIRRGQPTLYLPLSGRQVLTIAAPCEVAQAFATRALARLD